MLFRSTRAHAHPHVHPRIHSHSHTCSCAHTHSRWGRVLEVPSEDPTLAGALAAAMTRGIQEGNDTRYVKLLGALKHFTAYSMEHSDGMDRQGFSPNISKHDMADSYLPAYVMNTFLVGVMSRHVCVCASNASVCVCVCVCVCGSLSAWLWMWMFGDAM